MKLKKVLALVLAMVMTIALVACGNKNDPAPTNPPAPPTTPPPEENRPP